MPTAGKLARALGKAYPLFQDVSALVFEYAREWRHYGKNYGWQYKVSDAKRALCYITPIENAIRVTVGVREKERMDLLKSDRLPKKFRAEIESAKKHPEGFAVYVLVNDPASLATCKIILRALMDMRR